MSSLDSHAHHYEVGKPAGVFRFAPKNPLTLEDVSAILTTFLFSENSFLPSEKLVLTQAGIKKLGPAIRHFEKVV